MTRPMRRSLRTFRYVVLLEGVVIDRFEVDYYFTTTKVIALKGRKYAVMTCEDGVTDQHLPRKHPLEVAWQGIDSGLEYSDEDAYAITLTVRLIEEYSAEQEVSGAARAWLRGYSEECATCSMYGSHTDDCPEVAAVLGTE